MKWNSYKIETYVAKITQTIFDLEEKVEELLASDLAIDKLLIQLDIFLDKIVIKNLTQVLLIIFYRHCNMEN